METTIKDSGKKGILLTGILVVLSICAKAQDSPSFLSKLYKDNEASLYIIGGVFITGIVAFFVQKMVSKQEKEDEKNEKSNVRHISHRHHHHRVVKKTA